MTKLQNVWRLAKLATRTNSRPSELLDVTDPYMAFCVDEAVMVGAQLIEDELEKITHKKPKVQAQRRQTKLAQLLGTAEMVQYKTPSATK